MDEVEKEILAAAKQKLILGIKMDEASAYRFIRETAMYYRIDKVTVARRILRTELNGR